MINTKNNLSFIWNDYLAWFSKNNNNTEYNKNLEKILPILQDFILFFEKSVINFKNLSFSEFISKIKNLIENKKQLNDYLKFEKYKKQLIKLNQESFVNAVLNKNIEGNFTNIYLKRFYWKLVQKVIENEIPNSDSTYLDKIVSKFSSDDKDSALWSKDKIILENDRRIKNYPQNRQYEFLKREAAKTRKIAPLKTLFEKSIELILTVKPCLMLSPLTVSNFFKDIDFKFDTVIFDEASQIRPENAISSLFRAKQVIVVGDKEQMPPSDIFLKIGRENEFENEESEDEGLSEGYDSLLNLAEAKLESIKLKWHYRSKFEELIYTSNREIYKNLVTFPNSETANEFEGLKFELANWDEKISDENKMIKKAIEVLKKIIEKYQDKYSVGFVVFNAKVLQLLETKVDLFISQNPEFSFFFDENKNEPFFIKNIENVQGDERDIILFLLNNRRNNDGRINVHFGFINREESGYKRLNVAITRAKKGLILISTFDHSEVDWARSDKRGVKLLHEFMKNAKLGVNKLEDQVQVERDFDSKFEEEVYNKLVEKGLEVRKQVGSSGYRIDLAIVHKNFTNKYVLAIECDGASFHSSKTSRDRDRLRQQILESRGWKIHRIWSTDWFKNPDNQIAIILEKLNSIYQKSDENIEKTSQNLENKSYIEVVKSQNWFDYYPDIEKIIEENQGYFSTLRNKVKTEIVKQILQLTGAISRKNYENIIKRLENEERVTYSIKILAEKLVWNIAKIEETYNGAFVVPFEYNFKFRQSLSEKTKRRILDIHPDEIKDFILTFLNITNASMNLDDFCKEIAKKIQASISINLKQKTYVENILNDLAVNENKIEKTLNGDYRIKKNNLF